MYFKTQARWLEKISEFDFDVEYVPGVDNVLADALSRVYSNDAAGTVRTASEYVAHDEDDTFPAALADEIVAMPVLTSVEAEALLAPLRRTRAQTRAEREAREGPPAPTAPVNNDRRAGIHTPSLLLF